jgi:hypothetical protein
MFYLNDTKTKLSTIKMLDSSTAYGCSQWEHRSAGRVTRFEVCIAKRSTSKNGRNCLFFNYKHSFFCQGTSI